MTLSWMIERAGAWNWILVTNLVGFGMVKIVMKTGQRLGDHTQSGRDVDHAHLPHNSWRPHWSSSWMMPKQWKAQGLLPSTQNDG